LIKKKFDLVQSLVPLSRFVIGCRRTCRHWWLSYSFAAADIFIGWL